MGLTPKPDVGIAHAETIAPVAGEVRPAALQRGESLGRYVILEHLASGGMGAVYRAYDPDLDRVIAVKLVRVASADGTLTSGSSARMMREAQALARLSHPNVIAIYDVGVAAGDVFLAMELVEGQTLRAWMAGVHTPAAVLATLIGAGRGLAAAHAVGIVHRDIKPENILVGADGRVRVVDFGLAGATDAEPVAEDDHHTPVPRSISGLSTPLTRTGEMFGTPHYMAPEQYARRSVDARADQFGFCVTAYEALYGERPFAGDDLATLSRHVARGERRPMPEGRDVPPAVRDAILRGLSPDADARHPSMEALLAALEPAPAGRGRSMGWLLAAGLAVVAGLGTTVAVTALRDEPAACGDDDAALAGVWDDDVRARVRAAFLATGATYAAAAFDRLAAAVDRRTDAWRALRVDACQATHQRHERSEILLDLRFDCLDRRRDELAVLTSALTTDVTPAVIDRAVESVAALPGMSACASTAGLLSSAPMPDDPEAVAEIAAVRALIDGARALELHGDLDRAYDQAAVAADRAAMIDHAPLRMEVLKELAEWEEHVGRYDASEATLTELATLAARSGDDEGLADATIKMLWLAGTRRLRFEEAEAYARLAGALVERTTRTELRASRLLAIGALRIQQGDFAAANEALDAAAAIYEELGDPLDLAAVYTQRAQARGNLGEVAGALADMERALELRRATLGDDHPAVAASLSNVALWEKHGARYDAALAHAYEAVAIMERRAPDHPHLGSILQVLGLILAGKSEDEQAIALFERALPLLREAQGEDSPDVADLLNSLGFSLRARSRPADALARHQDALRIVEQRLGAEHPSTADTLVSVGLALVDLGRLDDADAAYRRALAAYEANIPADSPRLAVILTNIGELANLRHAYRDALAACGRALTIDEHNLGRDHPDLAYDLMCSGEAHAGLGAWDAAIAATRRALELREAAGAGDIAGARKQLDDYLARSPRSR